MNLNFKQNKTPLPGKIKGMHFLKSREPLGTVPASHSIKLNQHFPTG
jgi:hypothetical protein